MKKTICLLFLAVLGTVQVMAQVKISGTYKGETLTVIANRSDAGDIIKKVTYAPLTRLENDVKELKKQKESLQKEIEKLKKNTKVKELSDSLKIVDALLVKKNKELSVVQKDIDSLAVLVSNYMEELNRSNGDIEQLKKRISELQMKLDNCGVIKKNNSNYISVGLTLGNTSLFGNLTDQNYWTKKSTLSLQFQASYAFYFNKISPFAIKIGIGYGIYGNKGTLTSLYDTIPSLKDEDGDLYDARYKYHDIRESVDIKYLEMPITFHVGNSFNDHGVQAWADFGVKLGLNVGSAQDGKGVYTLEGYYPAWNVTIHDVEELGFVSEAEAYAAAVSPNFNKLVVWAIAAAGLRIPISNKAALEIAVNGAYTLTPVATHDAVGNKYIMNAYNLVASDKTKILSLGGNVGLSISF